MPLTRAQIAKGLTEAPKAPSPKKSVRKSRAVSKVASPRKSPLKAASPAVSARVPSPSQAEKAAAVLNKYIQTAKRLTYVPPHNLPKLMRPYESARIQKELYNILSKQPSPLKKSSPMKLLTYVPSHEVSEESEVSEASESSEESEVSESKVTGKDIVAGIVLGAIIFLIFFFAMPSSGSFTEEVTDETGVKVTKPNVLKIVLTTVLTVVGFIVGLLYGGKIF